MKLTEFAERGSIKEKLAWTFKLYDKDMSGGGTHSESIIKEELMFYKEP